MQAADLGEESCVPDLLGERILQNSLTFYLDETDEIYERYGRLADAYPYRQRNNYSRILKEKQIRTAVLENDRIKAVFLVVRWIHFRRSVILRSVMHGSPAEWNGILE